MFEKEAEEYAIGLTYPKFQDNQIANMVLRDVKGAFQKGAEFGYKLAHEEIDYLNKHWRSEEERKANEWHYDKNVPCYKTGTYRIIIYDNWREPTIISPTQELEHINGQENHIVAWKEIVPPKEIE